MIFGLDSYNNLEVPAYILCKPSNDRIGILHCTEKKHTIKFNDLDEISFTIYLYDNNEKNNYYEKVNELMHIELPDVGRFVINNITIQSEGTKYEYKECVAISEEALLAQRYLELFIINTGTSGSIDKVQFYNLSNPNKSLLNLVLEKCPDWTIGHVDNELLTMERSLEVDRQDVYSFLTNDVSKAFECIFSFDTINHRINVYKEENAGEDTNIHISYSNLEKHTSVSSSADDIKTCLTVSGADDLTVRDLNMGYDKIYNLEYFHSLEYMSQGLYDAYSIWKTKWNDNVDDYEQLSLKGVLTENLNGYIPKYTIPANDEGYSLYSYQKYFEEINYYTHEKMPDDENDISSIWEITPNKVSTLSFVTKDGELTLTPSFNSINIGQLVSLKNGTYTVSSGINIKKYTSGSLVLKYKLSGTATVNKKKVTAFTDYIVLKEYNGDIDETYINKNVVVPRTFTKDDINYTVNAMKIEFDISSESKFIATIKTPSIIKKMSSKNLIQKPDFSDFYDWSLYGLKPLEEKLAAYEAKQSVMIKANQGVYYDKPKDDSEKYQNNIYITMYLPCVNAIETLKEEIKIRTNTINNIKEDQNEVHRRMKEIVDDVEINNNFTPEQLKELYKYIREDELSSDNYIVTDSMTDKERLEMLQDLLQFGQEELAKISMPTLEFSMDMINIYAIPEFQRSVNKFYPGNYLYVTLRDDFSVKVRLLSMDINYLDKNDFSVTFGNVAKLKGNKLLQDITEALNLATSAATSVSFNSSSWNKANVESTTIGKMLSDGLLASGKRIETTQSDVLIDDRGIIVTNNPNSDYANDVIFIGGGQIVFSDDGLKTIKTALGRVQYTKTVDGKATTYNDFGLLAQFVIAGYIAGSVVEGTEINNGNGTFKVDAEGNLTATKATIEGQVSAISGFIGDSEYGFTIESDATNKIAMIYSGKQTLSDENQGIFISTKGIALGESNAFTVDSAGNLVASKATIKEGFIGDGTKGFKITSKAISNTKNTLDDDNNGIYISTDGIALGKSDTFKVDKNGAIIAQSGEIGGWIIGKSSISAVIKNDNNIVTGRITLNSTGSLSGGKSATSPTWSINSDGTATFKNVYITGVQYGSMFGGISYGTDGTYGNFSNGFLAGNSFGLSGGALTNFNNLVANKITANYIKSTGVLADYITATSVSAKYATITSLNAVDAKFDTLSSKYATIDNLNSLKAKIGDLEVESGGHFYLGNYYISLASYYDGNTSIRYLAWQKKS